MQFILFKSRRLNNIVPDALVRLVQWQMMRSENNLKYCFILERKEKERNLTVNTDKEIPLSTLTL